MRRKEQRKKNVSKSFSLPLGDSKGFPDRRNVLELFPNPEQRLNRIRKAASMGQLL